MVVYLEKVMERHLRNHFVQSQHWSDEKWKSTVAKGGGCLFNISHLSSTVCSETMAKRSQHDSGGERVTAKSRPMMSLIARVPSNVSSSISVSQEKRSYGNQNPWSIVAEKRSDQGDLISASTERKLPTTYIMSNSWRASLQQATQSGMTTVLGLLKSGKLILRCTSDRGDLIRLLEK